MKADILTREDITLLITEFYSKVRQDEILSPHFAAVDWHHHTPVIINFWSMILLGEQSYGGSPLAKHFHMNLAKKDFERWLFLFSTTVDEFFQGDKADEAKQRAISIAGIFQHKMNITD